MCPESVGSYRPADGTKIHGVPEALLKNVQTDEATGKETIAPDQAEHDRIVAEGGLANVLKNIDMSKLPTSLKCAVSGKILEDAVSLPCCRKTVSDSVIRAALVSTNMKCPLCHSTNVSVDDLVADEKARAGLEKFIIDAKARGGVSAGEDLANQASTGDVPVVAAAASSGTNPMSIAQFGQTSQNAMMMNMNMNMMGGGHGMNPMQLQQMMMSGVGMNMMQPMPGPYPGFLIDPFTGNMLPFDPSLIPWNMLPPKEFPSPVPYDVFIREQQMQRDYKSRVAAEAHHSSNRSGSSSPYDNLSEASTGASKSQPLVKEKKKEIKKCPHGRTEGYCTICKGGARSKSESPPVNDTKTCPPVKEKKEIKTCPHGRTEGYCTICKEETDEGLNAEKPSQSGKKKEIKTCPHGRTEGYCTICRDGVESSVRSEGNGNAARKDKKRGRSRDRNNRVEGNDDRDKKRLKERGRERSRSASQQRKVIYQEADSSGNGKKKGKGKGNNNNNNWSKDNNDLRYLIKTVSKGRR